MKTFQIDPLPPPAKLKLVLKGDVKRIWGSKGGIYKLQPTLVNNYPHWNQKSKSNSLWLVNGQWYVGMTSNLGKRISAISGPICDDDWPHNLCGNWRHAVKHDMIDSGEDVVFEEVI